MYQEELLQKYEDIIKEEINIKEIKSLDNSLKVKKIFKPIGGQLSAKFGKDTGKIIQFGKMGNIKQKDNNQIVVFDDQWNEWTLENSDYEIAYEGLDGDNIAIDNEIIAKLDLTITPELAKEGVAREISRFINQMRKDAKYNVDDKVISTITPKVNISTRFFENFEIFSNMKLSSKKLRQQQKNHQEIS
jgi:isoleucyl-tRNA synthetase